MKTTIIVATFLRLARQTFLNIAVVLILFWLPMDVLFRLSSWTLFMPALDIVNDVAMMILLLTLLAASVAMLVAGAGCALVGWRFQESSDNKEEAVSAVVAIGTLALIVTILLKMLKHWLKEVSGLIFTAGAAKPLILLLVIGVLAVLAWKYGLKAAGNAIQSGLAKGHKATLFLALAAGAVVTGNGVILHDYREIKTNPNSSPRAGMPNVILLSIDTLAAEDMSLYRYHLPTTPKLETFAKESFVFDNFFSSSNWTLPSVASFISGLYPVTSGVHSFNSYFLEDEQNKNLGEALIVNGYHTGAIVASGAGHPLTLRISDSFSVVTERPVRKVFARDPIFEALQRLKNYQTKVWLSDYFWSALSNLFPLGDDVDPVAPPELVFDRTLSFFTSLKQPSFIWSHIIPPHAPYLPAAPFKYKFGHFKEFSRLKDQEGFGSKYSPKQQAEVDQLRLRYDEFILDTDSRVGDFLGRLKTMGRFEDSIIVVTSDHGESFTKNFFQHGGPYLHQPLIHVPLMIHLPGQKEGKRIPFYAGQVDLLPTVMDLLDLPIPKWAEGESLKAAMLEGKPTVMPKFSMNLDQESRFVPPGNGTVAVMQNGWKLVRYLATGREELYHLASDPLESADLAGSNPEQAKKMRDLIYTRFKLGK